MNLRGQQGYAMAVLLVTLSVMAIVLSVVMPVWKHMSRREKETELVFRGQQYVHAIALYQRKHGPGVLPPNVDALLTEHYLRKKFKDPITNDDFLILTQGVGASTAGSPTPGANPDGRGGTGATTGPAVGRGAATGPSVGRGSVSAQQPTQGQAQFGSGQGGRGGGMIGVVSKSTAESIRIYNGRTHYNEWAFIFTPTVQTPGGLPTVPGQRQGGPGQRSGGPGPVVGPGGSPFPGGRGTPPNVPPGGRGRGRGPGV
jgi:type II secretory pathway pseudopilin PulG